MFYTNVVKSGNKILLRGYDSTGATQFRDDYTPTLYINSQKDEGYKLLDGTKVKPVMPGNMRECKDFIERYKEVEGFSVYGQDNYVVQYISDKFEDTINFDQTRIRVHYLDIETANEHGGFPEPYKAEEEILLITVYDTVSGVKTHLSTREIPTRKSDVDYHIFDNEVDMLKAYVNFHAANYPDVMTGWYSNGFDIPYMSRRILKVLGEPMMNRLSPWNNVYNTDKIFQEQMEATTDISGIACIDYQDLYKKFVLKPRENYQLETIAMVELGVGKLDHSQYATFKEFYTQNFQLYSDYNITDVERLVQLNDKLKLMDIMFTLAYLAKINYEDVFSPVKMWDAIIYNHLKKDNIVIPAQKHNPRGEFEGAFVREPITGLHKYVCSFDLQSLYPHIIMQYAISPENIMEGRFPVTVDGLANKEIDLSALTGRNVSVTGNGCMFKRQSALFPDLMQMMYTDRAKAKNQMLDLEKRGGLSAAEKNLVASLSNLEQALKIALNSMYGGTGSPYFRYYDLRIAEAITLSAQMVSKWVARKFDEYLNKVAKTDGVNYVLYGDTDSIYLSLEEIVKQVCPEKSIDQQILFMEKFCKEVLSKKLAEWFEELAEYTFAHQQKMFMKLEAVADKGIWVAKKKYLLNVYSSEGVRYEKPKLKVVGLQMIQSSTPPKVKDQLRDTVNVIINGTEEDVQNFIIKKEAEFKTFTPNEIAKISSVNDIRKYTDKNTLFTKGTPINVRSSILHNHYVNELKLQNQYQQIRDGDKIKFVYLKLPNKIKQDVIGFTNVLPTEFGLDNVVDYDTQFEKIYISPVKAILDVIGWNVAPTNSMEDLFG